MADPIKTEQYLVMGASALILAVGVALIAFMVSTLL
jgi:hypothetical protein